MTIDGPDNSSASTSRGQQVDNVKEKDPPKNIEIERESLPSNLMKVSLSAKSGNAKSVSGGKVSTELPYKPEKWMLPDQSEDKLSQLNLAIVNHPSKASPRI